MNICKIPKQGLLVDIYQTHAGNCSLWLEMNENTTNTCLQKLINASARTRPMFEKIICVIHGLK